MNYLSFKEKAEQYVMEKYETLDVLKVYNKDIQDKLHEYILPEMLKGVEQNGSEIKRIMNECKNFENRFYDEYRSGKI